MAESPFHSFTKSGTVYCGDFDWTTLYMGTEEAKQLVAHYSLSRPRGPGGVATGAGAAAGKRLIEMCRARDATAG